MKSRKSKKTIKSIRSKSRSVCARARARGILTQKERKFLQGEKNTVQI